MSVVVNIPQITVSASQNRAFGPTAASSLTQGDLAINRNAGASPLNTRTQDANVMKVVFEFSKDGGTTWPDSNSQTLVGGSFVNHDGSAKTVDHFIIPIGTDVNAVQGHVEGIITSTISGSITVT